MNLYLLRNGYVIIALKGSNKATVGYYTALERSHSDDLPDDFKRLVAKAEKEALERYSAVMG